MDGDESPESGSRAPPEPEPGTDADADADAVGGTGAAATAALGTAAVDCIGIGADIDIDIDGGGAQASALPPRIIIDGIGGADRDIIAFIGIGGAAIIRRDRGCEGASFIIIEELLYILYSSPPLPSSSRGISDDVSMS